MPDGPKECVGNRPNCLAFLESGFSADLDNITSFLEYYVTAE